MVFEIMAKEATLGFVLEKKVRGSDMLQAVTEGLSGLKETLESETGVLGVQWRTKDVMGQPKLWM